METYYSLLSLCPLTPIHCCLRCPFQESRALLSMVMEPLFRPLTPAWSSCADHECCSQPEKGTPSPLGRVPLSRCRSVAARVWQSEESVFRYSRQVPGLRCSEPATVLPGNALLPDVSTQMSPQQKDSPEDIT